MAYTVRSWGDFKNYQNTCYRNYLFAPEGLRVMGSTWSVLAPLKGLGDDVYLIGGEPHSASMAGTLPDESREDIIAAETAGLGFHSCSYLKLFVGHSWAGRNENHDDHLIAVSGPVALRRGSRVAFRGRAMPPGTRLTKLSVFSESVRAPLEAEWLLHLDPKAAVRETGGGLEAVQGGAVLELRPPLPQGSTLTWAPHVVARPEVEPFTFRETTRVVVRPVFEGNDAFLLTVLRGRSADASPLADLLASRVGRRVEIRFTVDGGPTRVDWHLARFAVVLEGGWR